MKIVHYSDEGKARYGIAEEDGSIRALAGSPFDSLDAGEAVARLDQVKVLAPVLMPRIIGVGLNYAAHAAEGGHAPPTRPMLFMLPSTAVIGHGDEIVYPLQGEEVAYEGELAVVIGKKARRVSQAEALDHVLGYSCGIDVSERVIQRQEMSRGCILVGKGFDTFCPLGPCIATGLVPTRLELRTRVNGEEKQHTNTADMIFPVAQLVSYISEAITLLPGDVIMTGTPSGVGSIVPGDTVEVEIEGIGILRNPVVAEEG